jgi:hypothetical protein
MDKAGRLGVERVAEGTPGFQQSLFEKTEPEWVEIDVKGVRVEHVVDFGGPWLGLELMHCLGLEQFFLEHVPGGREEIPWAIMAEVLVLCRVCHPSSELHIAEHFFEQTALADLLGIWSNI